MWLRVFSCTLTVVVLLLAELFEATGSGASAALLNTVIIGAVNVASTVVAILVVDRCGHCSLLAVCMGRNWTLCSRDSTLRVHSTPAQLELHRQCLHPLA